MSDSVYDLVKQGHYFWKLIYSGHYGEFSKKVTTRVSFSKETFLDRKTHIGSSFTFNNKTSVSVKYKGLGEGSEETSFTLHTELATDMEESTKLSESHEEVVETTSTFTAHDGNTLNVYQLCFLLDNSILESNTLVDEIPTADKINVKLVFSCSVGIPGLQDVLMQFAQTKPGESNIEEWKLIRDKIIEHSTDNDEDQLKNFVETLKGIVPGSSNTVEWAAIRLTCNEILNDWGAVDTNRLYRKLLYRFLVTSPGSENIEEWNAIHTVCDPVVKALDAQIH